MKFTQEEMVEFIDRFLQNGGMETLAYGHCDIPAFGKDFPYIFGRDEDGEYVIVFVTKSDKDFEDKIPPRDSVESLMVDLMKSGEFDDPGNIRVDTVCLLVLGQDRGIVRHHKAVSLGDVE